MKKSDFLELLNKAQEDENGNLYYIDSSIDINNKVYFATVTTICDDFIEEYCYSNDYDGEVDFEYYNRHFTHNDDTFEAKIVRSDKLCQVKMIEINEGIKYCDDCVLADDCEDCNLKDSCGLFTEIEEKE